LNERAGESIAAPSGPEQLVPLENGRPTSQISRFRRIPLPDGFWQQLLAQFHKILFKSLLSETFYGAGSDNVLKEKAAVRATRHNQRV
jgi:hypothetical protein